MTSSLRNSIHRRNHKERGQLTNRSRLGLLEKKKDYVLRAKDYHSKQDRITRLRQKAAERNKDEFYFSMSKEKTRGGVHVKERGNQALPVDLVKVLKSQDENYVRTMRASGQKKIDKIKSQLTALADLVTPLSPDEEGLDEDELDVLRTAGVLPFPSLSSKGKKKADPKHIVFVDTPREARNYARSAISSARVGPSTESMDVDVEGEDLDLGWKTPSSSKKAKKVASTPASPSAADEAFRQRTAQSNRTRLFRELSARLTRDKHLRYAEREFEMQRSLMAKGSRQKIAGVERLNPDEEESEDEDSRDAAAAKGRKASKPKDVDAKTWKPRVYKWKLERKR